MREREEMIRSNPKKSNRMRVTCNRLTCIILFRHANSFVIPDGTFAPSPSYRDCPVRSFSPSASSTASIAVIRQSFRLRPNTPRRQTERLSWSRSIRIPKKCCDRKPRLILLTATQHKIALIRDLGVAHLLIITFDKEFAATEPEDFVQQLVKYSKPLREICVGHEWSFGKNRRGNLELLKKLGAQFDFNVVGIPPVTVNGEVVSSTAIRQAVEAGDLQKAAQMLGREYTILGTVVRGDDLGKKIGFPTANLSAHSEQFPPNGVYFAEATLEGVAYPGVVNLGYRPTVSSSKTERILEIHLLDFDRDIYGKDLEVRFIRYLRPEKKFENVDALVRQIERDVQQARELCAA